MSGSYTGTARTSYRNTGGQAIDNCNTRSLIDPTPALLALFTDVDRLQWGLMTDWGHPAQYVGLNVSDSGASPTEVAFIAQVPPMVTHADLCFIMSGALKITATTAADALNVVVSGSHSPGSSSYLDEQAAFPVWAAGVVPSGSVANQPRALQLSTTSNTPATTQAVVVNLSIERGDSTASEAGFGGVLWGVQLHWVREPLPTFNTGDTADSLSV